MAPKSCLSIASHYGLAIAFAVVLALHEIDASSIVVKNNCPYPVWAGILGQTEPNGKKWSSPDGGGVALQPQKSHKFNVEYKWTGNVWGRTGCDKSGRCETGDCGGTLKCGGRGGKPPVTLAEFAMDGGAKTNNNGYDYYDISLVVGYNLKMRMIPPGNCRKRECLVDLNKGCPQELRTLVGGRVVGCRSGENNEGTPRYREHVKKCPDAYGFWNDDAKTTSCKPPAPGKSTHTVVFC